MSVWKITEFPSLVLIQPDNAENRKSYCDHVFFCFNEKLIQIEVIAWNKKYLTKILVFILGEKIH